MPAVAGIPGPAAYSPEWHRLRLFDPERKERPVVFGASEAAAACNCSPYSTAIQLYMEKRGELASFADDPKVAKRLRQGHLFEKVILDIYEEETGTTLTRGLPTFYHPSLSFMAATPDAIEGTVDDCGAGVEAKSSSERMIDRDGGDEDKFGEDGTDQVPMQYLLQAQHQMAVLGLTVVKLPVLFTNRSVRIYTVQRDEQVIGPMVEAQRELAERIVNGEPPEPNWSHQSTRKAIRALYGIEPGTSTVLKRGDRSRWLRLEKAKLRRDAADKVVDELQNQILNAMNSAESATFLGSDIRIKRVTVRDSIWSPEDIEIATSRQGQVKKKGHERLKRLAK